MAEVVIVPSEQEAGRLVGDAIVDLIQRRPDAVLGLATGSTPLAVYRHLAERVRSEGVDVSRVRGFALDEYVGLPAGHPESYRSVIEREVVEPVGFDPARIEVPHGDLDGIETAGSSTRPRSAPPVGSTCRSSASAAPGTSASTSRAARSPR